MEEREKEEVKWYVEEPPTYKVPPNPTVTVFFTQQRYNRCFHRYNR